MTEKIDTKSFYDTQVPNDWKLKKLGALCEICYGKDQKLVSDKNGPYDVYGTGGVVGKASKYLYDKPSILIGRKGSIDVPFLIREPFWAIDTTYFTKMKNGVSIDWLYYKLHSLGLKRYNEASGVPSLSRENLYNIKIPVPPLSEQKAIAQILSLMDIIIKKSDLLITKKELQRKWVGRQLLSGKIRVKEFIKVNRFHRTGLGELPVDWKLNPIEKILTPVRKSFIPDSDELYQEIGIRSHTRGLFYKEKVKGKTLGDKRVFWIEPNCFVVNIVFAWEHAIAKTTDKEIGMIASHRFPMFKPKEGMVDLDYLLYYFNSMRGKHLLGLASPGGAGRNKTLGQSEFLKLQIPTPPIDEQIAIAQVLQSADREIQIVRAKTEKLRLEKKGLMQQLLTGKKRLITKIKT